MDDMSFESRTKRKSLRREFHSHVEYETDDNAADATLKGHTINISDSGLCICFYNPIAEGQKIRIKNSTLPFSYSKAVVCWVRKIDKKTFMAGVACME
jgi:hypothetical protein